MIMNTATAESGLSSISFPSLCQELREHICGGMPGTAEGLERYSTTLTTLSERMEQLSDSPRLPRSSAGPTHEQLLEQIEQLRNSVTQFTQSRQISFPESAFDTITASVNTVPSTDRSDPSLTAAGRTPDLRERTPLLGALSKAQSAVSALLSEEIGASDGSRVSLEQLYQGKGDGRHMRSLLNAATGALGGVLTQISRLEK